MKISKFVFLFSFHAALAMSSMVYAVVPSAPTFQPLGDLADGTFNSEGWAVSPDGGTIAGFGNSASGREAYRWTSGGGMVGLGDLPGGSFDSTANSISTGGSAIVGWSSSSSGTAQEAFMWTAGGGMVGLGDLPGGAFSSYGNYISADG